LATVCTSRLFYREPGDWFLIILPIVVRCFIRLLSCNMNPHAFPDWKIPQFANKVLFRDGSKV
jgi:hypothetical protein